MKPDLSSRQHAIKRIWKGALISVLLILGFLFVPAAVRRGCAITTKSSDIEAVRQHYWALVAVETRHSPIKLDAVYRRHMEVAAWLEARNINPDPGIRDEAVENAPYFIALYGSVRWQWEDLFHYWSIPSERRDPVYLLSDVEPSH